MDKKSDAEFIINKTESCEETEIQIDIDDILESREKSELDNVKSNDFINSESDKEKNTDKENNIAKRTRKIIKTVGNTDDLVPFSWRFPLQTPENRMSKPYKTLTQSESERLMLMPLREE